MVGYARLTLRSKELGVGSKIASKANTVKTMDVWKDHQWDLNTGWLFGGAGLALTYDLLFDEMTAEQRTVVRQAISAAITGRRSWQLGEASGHAMTNWCLYPAHLAVMALAIEGEEGSDPELVRVWIDMIRNYLRQPCYASGANNEDTYPEATSLRDSAAALVAFQRRGERFLDEPNLRTHLSYIVQSLQPWDAPKGSRWEQARFRGHGAGSSDGHPSFYAMARTMYPHQPLANHLWRWYMGADYQRNLRWQSLGDMILFPAQFDGSDPAVTDRGRLGLPMSIVYPERGLQISRSDWSDQALYVHFDARTDAFLNGHDNADRGTFTLDALGRAWAIDGDWMGMRDSDEHSLVRVDGQGEAWKPPMARLLSHDDRPGVVVSAVDLTYSYRWQWSAHSPWPTKDTTFPAPWEKETSDPRTLGLPDLPALSWIPHSLYGQADVGFIGLYYWRRPNLPVQYAFRSLGLRRGPHPYLVVVDDLALDAKAHQWQWLMQVDTDLTLARSTDALAILAPEDAADGRRLEVHVAGGGPVAWNLESFAGRNAPGKGKYKGKHMDGRRLIGERSAVKAGFRMVLAPVGAGAKGPEVAAAADGGFTVTWEGRTDTWTAAPGPDGRAQLTLVGGP